MRWPRNWSRCPVIAREWRYLEPVRACCEEVGVPVQAANETPPSFWRLRETQALLASLRADPTGLVGPAGLAACPDTLHLSPFMRRDVWVALGVADVAGLDNRHQLLGQESGGS